MGSLQFPQRYEGRAQLRRRCRPNLHHRCHRCLTRLCLHGRACAELPFKASLTISRDWPWRGRHVLVWPVAQTLDNVKDYVTKMLPPLAEHFGDKSASYRAFLKRGPIDFRGTALAGSGIIGFDKDTGKEHDWDVVRSMNRIMISGWARLDPEEDGSRNEWFTDGQYTILHLEPIHLNNCSQTDQPPKASLTSTLSFFLSASNNVGRTIFERP